MSSTLARRLRMTDAVMIGLGSMIGAGIFTALTPAARAGSWMLLALAVAAGLAWCNATSTAQLAAAYPQSGGSYHYGRMVLGPWPGFLAGWGFVVGKSASAAAMALGFAVYAVPSAWQRPTAIAAVLVLAAVNYRGITKTAKLTRILVILVLMGLLTALALSWGAALPGVELSGLWPAQPQSPNLYLVLQAAGLLFFAFAGYARLATLGEEVIDPRRTIPRAISIALLIVVALYAVLAASLLLILGPEALAADPTALATATGSTFGALLVKVTAALATLGALLGLVAGLGRTSLAMAREGDLPKYLDAVHPRFRVPHHAELVFALIVCAVIAFGDLVHAIGFSSFGVLLYYFIANWAAFRQTGRSRRSPRAVQLVGMIGCLLLAFMLPLASVASGVVVFLLGIGYRVLRLRHSAA